MELTLKHLLDIGPLKQISVRAGWENLDHLVKSVAFFDCPEGIRYLKGSELVLTSGYLLLGKIQLQETLMQMCSQKKVAALGFTDSFFNTLEWENIFTLANQYGIPVLSLPKTISFNFINEFINNNYFSRKDKTVAKKLDVVVELNEGLRANSFLGLMKVLQPVDRPPSVRKNYSKPNALFIS